MTIQTKSTPPPVAAQAPIIRRLLVIVARALRQNIPQDGAPAVLVLQYAMPLGCCVHGTPLLAAIKQGRPDLKLVVATRGTGWATLRHNPHLDALLVTRDPLRSRWQLWLAARDIRRQIRALGLRPQMVLLDASSMGGRFAWLALLVRLAPTAGFAALPELFERHFDYDLSRSLIDNSLRLATVVGAETAHIEPEVFFDEAERRKAQVLLAELNPEGRPVVAVAVRGRSENGRRWHEDRFSEVVRRMECSGRRVIFVGAEDLAGAVERVRATAAGGGGSLIGRTSVTELAAVLCLCDLLLTMDTGTLHVGRAVGVPIVLLGCKYEAPIEWLPLGQAKVRILRAESAVGQCPPNYRHDDITVEKVVQSIEELFQAYPASEASRVGRAARWSSSIL